MAKSKKAGLGKIAFGGREHILAITAAADDERGMMAYTMRYQEELRKPSEYFSDIKNVKVDEDSLELAETLIKPDEHLPHVERRPCRARLAFDEARVTQIGDANLERRAAAARS